MEEPEIVVQSREQLAELLTEAVEVEHNLMCCYLFAAWSLKSGEAEGLSAEQAAAVASWRETIVHVAIDEMTHFANANNLLAAIGSQPRLGRPNFPVSPGYHPAGVVVELRRFDASTLDHFVFLERPEGVDLPDGEGFTRPSAYRRATRSDVLMPSAQDYATVGRLYRGIRQGLASLATSLGEEALFVGDHRAQISPDDVQLDGLVAVTDLASALQAVDNIVRQGEGNEDDPEDSHYRRFCAVRDGFAAHRRADPDFDPARPVVRSPVQRRPPVPDGKTWIGAPDAAALLDLCNAVYNHMLRLLGVVYQPIPASTRAGVLGEAIGLMRLLVPMNEVLTRLPASEADPHATAGMSFAVTREIRVPAAGPPLAIAVDRTRELAEGAARLVALDGALAGVADRLGAMADRIARLPAVVEGSAGQAPAPVVPVAPAPPKQAPAAAHASEGPPRQVIDGVEYVEGEKLQLRFDTHRCIHARHCVLDAPEVFLANVEGAWIFPDAMDVEDLVAVAHRCPSGAITYTRKDGRPDERPPKVNRLNVRENGPLAVMGDVRIDGEPPRTRAVLCRCGASKRKPFCDGSHAEIGFTATGEPPKDAEIVALESRYGPVEIRPQPDGNLLVKGNLELCTGTGATFAKRTKCALCRCGASANKPFCDGSHRRIGFTTE